jgi:hypothetical protein
MSKQVKLKFKKSLKKAEFVHADLEYHEELISDAKREFFAKVDEIFNGLCEEDKKKINDAKKKRMEAQANRRESDISGDESEDEVCGLPESEEMLSTDPVDKEEGEEESVPPSVKSSDLRKLFHDIADLCHPDKTEARGLAAHEIKKLEKVFKEAQSAYKSGNWYLLYVIALDLGIDVDDPTADHVEWVEEDIKYTLEKISQIGTLVVWVWFNGDGLTKLLAMQNYFQQSFGYDLRI